MSLPQEKIFADFSGGMNALAAVGKLAPNECLLAENVRLDETGNVLSAGAVTHQNTSVYAAVGGLSRTNLHSLYWNPSLGAVAGVSQDVFAGPTLGGMVNALTGSNGIEYPDHAGPVSPGAPRSMQISAFLFRRQTL
jgi:hypothetical protein